jgi:DNA polymerase I-like protein with 3'-5' exonuclease and polymerase domains|tara:strand:- start:1669 stop:2379 length:711 start_codon:yes stop_codon:yes gene_type:complete
MILNADAKALEWVCASYLSKDKTAHQEIWDEIDQHTDNQNRFGLPSRLIAKTFVFRLIYGGSAFSYANDPNFKDIGNEMFWQNVIDQFYRKYTGLKEWHDQLMFQVKQTNKLIMPTGRTYKYLPETNSMGNIKYPRTRILNYPVQGLGADLMTIARISLYNKIAKMDGVKLINTVHDSIMLDFDPKVCYTNSIVQIVKESFENVPANFKHLFGKEFNLPMRVDIQVGNTWGNLTDI